LATLYLAVYDTLCRKCDVTKQCLVFVRYICAAVCTEATEQ